MLPLLSPIFCSLWLGHLQTICIHRARAPLLTSVISRLQTEHSVKRVLGYVQRHLPYHLGVLDLNNSVCKWDILLRMLGWNIKGRKGEG